MTPPFSKDGGNSGGAPASSAPHASAEESGVAPELTPVDNEDAQSLPEEGVASGEPESPVAPVADEPGGADEPSLADEPIGAAEERTGVEHEQQLERDLDELTAKAQKADEYLELAQRTRADFENYRKRAAREAAAAQERGVVKLVKELLPAVDNLDRAVEAAAANGGSAEELVSGVKLVHAEVIAALGRAGVELYSPAGERFDPTQHEAVAQHPVEGAEPGTVVEVYQRGCRLGESVIRPARVLVAG